MAKTDESVAKRIENLAQEEHRLWGQSGLGAGDRERLEEIRVELDQCWDLLHQRQALRNADQDPAAAKVRPAEVVESYYEGD